MVRWQDYTGGGQVGRVAVETFLEKVLRDLEILRTRPHNKVREALRVEDPLTVVNTK